MIDAIFKTLKDHMEKAVQTLLHELGRIRTGRASTSLLDGIKVDYYGTPTPLNQLATLATPEPKLITIQPWDASVIGAIEKAILQSELGLTPVGAGKVIRIPIPALTEERRKELVKLVKKMAEENKVALRNIRRDANESLKKLEKDKKVTEDEFHHHQTKVQEITDQYIKRVDQLISTKEKEIMEV